MGDLRGIVRAEGWDGGSVEEGGDGGNDSGSGEDGEDGGGEWVIVFLARLVGLDLLCDAVVERFLDLVLVFVATEFDSLGEVLVLEISSRFDMTFADCARVVTMLEDASDECDGAYLAYFEQFNYLPRNLFMASRALQKMFPFRFRSLFIAL